MRLRQVPTRPRARTARLADVPRTGAVGQTRSARAETSEILEQAPGIAPEAQLELDSFEAEMHRFLRGELSPERWRAFRLAHGVYGQRQPGVQMIRVKIPTGALNGPQLVRLADLSERFGTGVSHLTTRQDVQFHFIALEEVPAVLRLLAEAGLTTREACGNSVRNVTACPLTGFIAEELFEVRPYALATYAFLVRNAFCQQMARKFKIAFSACPEDCAATAIHDIGAIGRIQEDAGRMRFGFKLVVGGGLGSTPFTAEVLEEFVPIEDLLPTVKSILLVFSDQGNRLHKMKARLKFVVHRLGIAKLRELVAARRKELTREELEDADLLRYVPNEDAETVAAHLGGRTAPILQSGVTGGRVQVDASALLQIDRPGTGSWQSSSPANGAPSGEYRRWLGANVRAHRAPGRAVVTVLVPLGDLEAAKLRELARLATAYGDDHVRIARDQNLVFPSVDSGVLPDLYEGLAAAGLAEAGIGSALDVTSCPGADTCALGITSSKGLARAIRSELLTTTGEGGADLLRDVTIKISGCPNGCGQHHIASIGFHGVAKKIGADPVPAYQLHLGGRVDGRGGRIGAPREKIPARNVPKAVAALLRLYGDCRLDGESFADFAVRVDDEALGAALAPLLIAHSVPASPVAALTAPTSARDTPASAAAALTAPSSAPAAPRAFGAAPFWESVAPPSNGSVAAGTTLDATAGARQTDPAPGAIAPHEELFVDWGKTERFGTDEIGVGECAGAGTDAAVHPFDNYEAELRQAELFIGRDQWVDALANLNRSQYTLARILLERLGKHPETDYECTCEMRAQIIDRGYASERWDEQHRDIERAMRPKRPDPEAVRAIYARAIGSLEEGQSALSLIHAKGAVGTVEFPG